METRGSVRGTFSLVKGEASSLYGGKDPRDMPIYSIVDAARYLGIPAVTLGTWIHGRSYPTTRGRRSSDRIIETPGKGGTLSWTNLAEAHVLGALRRYHKVSMPSIRRALRYVKREYGWEHPLIEAGFKTDGVNLFVDEIGPLVNASKEGQTAIRDSLSAYLERLDWAPGEGLATRLFPFVRQHDPRDPKLVLIDARRSFGRPVIAGTGIPTSSIADRFFAGDSPEDLAKDFALTEAQVLEAVRYERRAAA
jgi:uncharacterized protein (DUF433 family)